MPVLSSQRLTKIIIDKTAPGRFAWDSDLRGFGVRVSPAGTRSFILQYRAADGTKQRRMTLGQYPALTVDQARSRARVLLGEIAKGNDPSGERQEARAAPTVADGVRHYLGRYAQARALRKTTIASARHVLETYALAELGSQRIKDVSAKDVERLHAHTRDRAGPYQANRLLACLSRIFNIAIRDELRMTNPCRGVQKFAADERWRNFSDDEVARILCACNALSDQSAANAIRLLLFTGARLQEVLKSEWEQFDLERGIWTKPSSHTKQKRQHRLSIAGPALKLAREMRQADPDGRFLFPGRDAKYDAKHPEADLRRPRVDLKRSWKAIKELAALKDARLHDLRRTTASFMLNNEVPLAIIGSALGHTQVATTARYARLRPEAQRIALEEAGERMVALLEPPSPPRPVAACGAEVG